MNDKDYFRTASATPGLLIIIDDVGPYDNRPSTYKLHHFAKNNVTCDM